MKAIGILAGDVDVQDVVAGWNSLDNGTRDALIILLAMVLVTGLAVAGAWFMRHKKRLRRRSHHHHHDHSSESAQTTEAEYEESASGSSQRRRKWRRRRREHRPRNPTLAETGGLPPIREGPPNTGP